MGGCRCSYRNCNNTTKTTENIHFFHYPVKQKDRCKAWIQNAQQPRFYDLDEFQLRNKVVCEIHFEDDNFLNSQKKRLLPSAIPTLDGIQSDSNSGVTSSVPNNVFRPKDRYKQFSTKMDDIQVLPANDDGTIFVLDTYPSYKVSKEVKSYILDKDALLPMENNFDSTLRVKNEQVDVDIHEEFILSDDGHLNVFQKNPLEKVTEPQVVNYKYDKSPNRSKMMQNSIVDSSCSNMNTHNDNPSVNNVTDEKLEMMISKTLESKYLSKLEQHTKDLNHIKKALRLSRNTRKITKPSVLKYLKLKLPPTLFTLVNLSLEDDYTLSEDDETFFKNLHETSPKAYQFLMDDCNWRIPIIQIHDEDSVMEDH